MSTRTPAVADDFPHFHAWYGRLPDFRYAAVRPKDYHCRDQVFAMRQLVDARYYLHWHYSDADSYGPSAYFKAAEDWLRCRRIWKMNAEDRPAALQDWFRDRYRANNIWEYREPPALIGKHDSL
eukprot:TRINITY_DN21680_c0_g1_i1.p1 TRINITY_DN21680_c0_g1~~TRINITY_DN21680_c0_g1_i1.p1  ORF type:complete len:124 (-),score=16.81 TRINITY_DN21680_c0_g1_i1:214-585(-)